MKKIYLACPYTGMEEESFEKVTQVAGRLMEMGYIVFSPITHGHSIAQRVNLPVEHEFWLPQCKPFVEWADEIFVLTLDGWKESRGVNWEIDLAFELKKKISTLVVRERELGLSQSFRTLDSFQNTKFKIYSQWADFGVNWETQSEGYKLCK